jgi:hypothetical protein
MAVKLILQPYHFLPFSIIADAGNKMNGPGTLKREKLRSAEPDQFIAI